MLRKAKNWMMKLRGLPTCQEVEDFAYDYLEEQLPVNLIAKFERHLRGCVTCKRFIDSYRQVARPSRLARRVPLDPDFERRVVYFLTQNIED